MGMRQVRASRLNTITASGRDQIADESCVWRGKASLNVNQLSDSDLGKKDLVGRASDVITAVIFETVLILYGEVLQCERLEIVHCEGVEIKYTISIDERMEMADTLLYAAQRACGRLRSCPVRAWRPGRICQVEGSAIGAWSRVPCTHCPLCG